MDRRTFLKLSTIAGSSLAFPHVSRLSAQERTSDRLNVAYIGVGGHGKWAAQGNVSENRTAFCDVDDLRAAETYSLFPDVPRFRDFRKLFDALGSGIDAVSIATPDHTHFPIAMEALQRGYHVYLEKPMAHTIWEIRTLQEAAAKSDRITQLGLQGHSMAGLRVLKEWLDAGIIGTVHEAYLWTDRPYDRDFHHYESDAPAESIPSHLDWDLWLGPARYRPYNSIYLPTTWRGWWDFGNGPLGDIGAHMWDVLEFCLSLGSPTHVTGENPRPSLVGTPRWSNATYQYPKRGDRPKFTVHWSNGVKEGKPNQPRNLPFWPEGKELNIDSGIYLVGSEGAIYYPAMRAEVRPTVFPESRWEAVKSELPSPYLPRIKGSHHTEFFNAIRENRPANADFSYGAPLCENVLVGNLALKTGKPIHWDSANLRATGLPEADAFIHPPEPRPGWRYK